MICRPNLKRPLALTIGVGHLRCTIKYISPMLSIWRKAGREKEARQMMSAWLSHNFNSFRQETLERVSQLFDEAIESTVTLQ